MTHFRLLAGVALAFFATGALAGSAQKAKNPPAEDNYYVPYLTGPAGEKRKAMDVPGGVTVVSRKFMDDIQARSLSDALRYAPGVQIMGR